MSSSMKIKFYDFILDTDRQSVFHQDTEIDITKINYEVLLYFAQNQHQIITKDQLINHVWKDKLVTDNSVDQSVSKIRKLLAKFDERTVIKTVFGKGLQFEPEAVRLQPDHSLQTKTGGYPGWALWGVSLVMLITAIIWLTTRTDNTPIDQPPILLLNRVSETDWLNDSSRLLFKQLLSNNSDNYLLDENNKPSQLTQKAYIENFWRIQPALEVVTTDLLETPSGYVLTMEVSKRQETRTEQFKGDDLVAVFSQAQTWLVANSSLKKLQSDVAQLLPADDHVLELYLRGLNSLNAGELEQAFNYTTLAVKQDDSFILARLQLADVQYKQGDSETALTTLDALQSDPHYAQVALSAQILRGDILDTAGRYPEAIAIYENLIAESQHRNPKKILAAKYNLSYALTATLEYQSALKQLDDIIQALQDQSDPGLLADALQKKGSVLLQIGQTAEARQLANQSYQLYQDLADSMGAGKASILMARISNHESDYEQAEVFLRQAIEVYRHAEYPLGVGATLNELIYILLVNGKFTSAWEHMVEMQEIALKIDYFAMLMAAKQVAVEITRVRKQWPQAEAALAEYLDLATRENFTRGVFKHKLLGLDLALDREQVARAETFIDDIQAHIDVSGEKRLQPRLNIQRARALFLQGENTRAIQLLHDSKTLAQATEDMESIHQIDLQLLEHYVNTENYAVAQELAQQMDQQDPAPQAYPYLLLKSKIKHAQGDEKEALSLAKASKARAHEFWQTADEQYLSMLIP